MINQVEFIFFYNYEIFANFVKILLTFFFKLQIAIFPWYGYNNNGLSETDDNENGKK